MRQKIFVTNTSQWDKNVREKIFFQDWSHIGFWCVSVDFNQQYRRTVTFLSISNLLSLVYSACFIQVYCIANHAWNSANGWWWGIVEIFILSPFLWHCKSLSWLSLTFIISWIAGEFYRYFLSFLSRLALYVYEYLLHVGAQKAAQTFLNEIRWEKNITLGEPPGFLHSWWW